MILKQYWAHSGYDAEELYFAKINRDLIARIKQNQGKEQNEPGPTDSAPPPLAQVIPFPGPRTQAPFKKVA